MPLRQLPRLHRQHLAICRAYKPEEHVGKPFASANGWKPNHDTCRCALGLLYFIDCAFLQKDHAACKVKRTDLGKDFGDAASPFSSSVRATSCSSSAATAANACSMDVS